MAYTTINKSSDHVKNIKYSGTDNSNAITGVGFQPDFTWIKNFSTASFAMQDVVRGVDKTIRSNSSSPQYTNSFFTSFDSDGFTVATSETDVNAASQVYASFNWKASGGTTSSNTDGSITSTVSANVASGFSIIKYTGTGSNASIGHGLGVKPAMIMIKNLATSGEDWAVYHKALGGYNKYLKLNSTSAESDNTDRFNAEPTIDVVNIGSVNETNQSGVEFIAYVFAEKQGFSKFGSFSAANPGFRFTGFRPSFVMLKRYNATGGWHGISDIVENTYNPQNPMILNENYGWQAETFNLVSNGFQITNGGGGSGGDSGYYVYYAVGQPLVGTNNIPSNAR
tara:strand:- start:43 stop:1059 length:1017 start_codon:yes stop_codon:yes gene_type:complete